MPASSRLVRVLEGRKNPRIAGRSLVQICSVHDPRVVELTTVDNVSLYGARVTTQRYWEPGTHVEVKSTSGEFLRPVVPRARARVVYCHAINGKGFAIGLDFFSKASESDVWSMPPTTKSQK